MNILMVTNSYTPLVNGVARSVASFAEEYRRRGHRVLVVAPRIADDTPDEADTLRLPAIQNFNGTDFAVSVPLFSDYFDRLDAFRPDIVHSHHPFLLGVTAVRIASRYSVPLVFTYHTMYEHYTHYVPGNHHALREFVAALSVGYCRFADAVIAPSESVAGILRSRGVETPIAVIPTGIDVDQFRGADRTGARRLHSIPRDAFVVGHAGRLAPEKNVGFLARSVGEFLRTTRRAHFLVVGDGAERETMTEILGRQRVLDRCHFAGTLEGQALADAYAAMDVFAFASRTETQGLVLIEAMAVGTPVVALDASGVRDVVHDRGNGRLILGQSSRIFVAALRQFAALEETSMSCYRSAATQTASAYSMTASGDKGLALYEKLRAGKPRPREIESSAWAAVQRRIGVEVQLLSHRAQALGTAVTSEVHPSRIPGLRHVIHWLRRLRRMMSRREWSVRLLRVPVFRGTTDEPGLVLLQIDGLSRGELERALQRGRMPFLGRLLRRESYCVESMYSGQPTTTPAVLGELFYGVPQAVPSFGFRDHRTGEVVQMFQPGIASRMQTELAQRGEGLLDGGSAYCDIYSGGALESSFCPATTGWHNLEDAALWRKSALLFMNPMIALRIAWYFLVELGVAVVDCARGIRRGREIRHELLYIPRRLIVNVILQEITAIGAEIDVTRGIRALHANFLAYDENAHRRGPDSLFAHYALQGIDRALRRIWNAAHASHRRNYHVWIMSDHGQQRAMPYSREYGRSLDAAVRALWRSDTGTPGLETPQRTTGGDELQRSSWLRNRTLTLETEPQPTPGDGQAEPVTVAIGPLGYVYWPSSLDDAQTDEIARRLVTEAHVPLVAAAVGQQALAWTAEGRFELPQEAAAVFAPNHPHLDKVARDFAKLCFHPDAGTFVVSGWRNGALPLTFVTENGAHGGPGPEETTGFVVLPRDAPRPDPSDGAFRPGTLRRMARSVLGRGTLGQTKRARRERGRELRVVTYNVHSCIGLDGRLSPSRIARVLAALDPDVIALQELDVLRKRSGFVHQAEEIARALEMELHFHPSFDVEHEQYGNAVLSRLAMRLVQAGRLPQERPVREPRGALWVELDVGGMPLQLVTTHLGTSPAERDLQIEHLMGPAWLGDARCRQPVVLCGDLNATTWSRGYRRVCARLRDAQLTAEPKAKPRRTWFGPFPLTRIDHVFVDDALRVKSVEVPGTHLARVASDHLPLAVDLEIPLASISGEAIEEGADRLEAARVSTE